MDHKNKIPWFEKDKDIFKKKSTHHAYIFEGPKGIGKKSFVLEVAKGFLCNSKQNIETVSYTHLTLPTNREV